MPSSPKDKVHGRASHHRDGLLNAQEISVSCFVFEMLPDIYNCLFDFQLKTCKNGTL